LEDSVRRGAAPVFRRGTDRTLGQCRLGLFGQRREGGIVVVGDIG
jgi:hypothetical protein